MVTLPQNADVHYREATDCLNALHDSRMDALGARHWDGDYWRNPLNGERYCGDYSCGPYTEVLR